MKKIALIIAASVVFALLSSCSKEPETLFRVAALKGPTAMGMVKMMDDSESRRDSGGNSFTIAGSADEITAALSKGEIDIAAVPCNLAAVLYNKLGGKIRISAVNTLGVLYLLEKGDSVKSVADLRGKTVYTTGKGTTPEYILDYCIRGAGLSDGEVDVQYLSEATEVASQIQAGKADIAMLPQPFVTTVMSKDPDLRVALDMSEEFSMAARGQSIIVTGVLIARTAAIDRDRDAFNKFLDEYKDSINFTNDNVDEAAKLIAGYEIVPEAVAKKAVPECNIMYMDGDNMKVAVENYLNILFEANPASVGGSLPDEKFYYKK